MSSVPARLAAFAVLLAVVFGAAALLGGAIDPSGAEDGEPAHAEATPAKDEAHGDEGDAHGDSDAGDAHGTGTEAASHAKTALPGLAAAQDGLRLVLDDPRRAAPADRAPIRFRIVGDDGRPVRDFDVSHEKRMHLIVVRRDLAGFQHLHPEMGDDGTWSVRGELPAGVHRVFADFTVDGEQHTLGTDLHVGGAYRPVAVPQPATVARLDGGLEVELHRDGDRLDFHVLRDGRPVDDELEPYLGAKGHLVTLRTADLAFLHAHPEGDELAFVTELPTAGTYRVWVQFQLDGRVHTAAFTQEIER